jgi:PelA/Pel-15E family pectate lyase
MEAPVKAKAAFILLMIFVLTMAAGSVARTSSGRQDSPVTWRTCLTQNPAWYKTKEAVRIADNVLLYQRQSGGWPKNIDMATVLSETEKAAIIKQKADDDSTIDNEATYTQVTYLARVFTATPETHFKEAFIKGLDYLLAAQYDHGGWPQYHPRRVGYYRHITFNDDAMIGVMKLLEGIGAGLPDYGFVDEGRKTRARRAVQKGVECILKCQIVVDGQLTAWCAQHDEVTFAPAPARTYEKVSLSGSESVGIIRFLMKIENPDPKVVKSVEAGVAWLKRVQLNGIKVGRRPDASLPKGYDLIVVHDPKAPPIWARFYEIGSNRPIFCGRDGVIKNSLAEIEYERRTGYSWYSTAPARLLAEDYPRWHGKWASAPK